MNQPITMLTLGLLLALHSSCGKTESSPSPEEQAVLDQQRRAAELEHARQLAAIEVEKERKLIEMKEQLEKDRHAEENARLRAQNKTDGRIRENSLTTTGETRIIDGEFDYGCAVSFVVENHGEDGIINLWVRVTSSEGEWERTQAVPFKKNEAKRLSYFFEEPSISATNMHSRVTIVEP